MILGIVAAQDTTPSAPAWATWNPLDKHGGLSLSNANRTLTRVTSDGNAVARATVAKDGATGEGYFEYVVDDPTVSPFATIGLAPASLSLSSFPGATSDSFSYYQQTGEKYNNNTPTSYGTAWDDAGDIVMVFLRNGKLYFGLNGTWSGDPVAETGAAFSGLTGALYPATSLYRVSADTTFLCDPADHTYGPPSPLSNPGWGT